MSHLRKRLDRLEALRGGGVDAGPLIIFVAEAGGEVHAALVSGGGALARETGESVCTFIERANSNHPSSRLVAR